MKIYLAAGHNYIKHMVFTRQYYLDAGFEVTSRWIDGLESEANLNKAAELDIADVDAADALVAYNLPGSSTTGGRHVEFGYAIAKRKIVILVGPPENVFHYHNNVVRCKSTKEAIGMLNSFNKKLIKVK
jgi:nucleoside 2-deoxyribosyltransferase